MLRQIADGSFTVRNLKRRLNSDTKKLARRAASRRRKERAVRDTVLYRGPILCEFQFEAREVKTGAGHRVSIGVTDRDLAIKGIRVPCPLGSHPVIRDSVLLGYGPDGDYPPIEDYTAPDRNVTIPKGSRVLFDDRNGSGSVRMVEVVLRGDGLTCLYFWYGQGPVPGSMPYLSGGVVYDSNPTFGTRLCV
jgi:hypothetical protein